eukprot:4435040-Ditylum_brightwellii.AAC.1
MGSILDAIVLTEDSGETVNDAHVLFVGRDLDKLQHRQHNGVHNDTTKALIFDQGVDCWGY